MKKYLLLPMIALALFAACKSDSSERADEAGAKNGLNVVSSQQIPLADFTVDTAAIDHSERVQYASLPNGMIRSIANNFNRSRVTSVIQMQLQSGETVYEVQMLHQNENKTVYMREDGTVLGKRPE